MPTDAGGSEEAGHLEAEEAEEPDDDDRARDAKEENEDEGRPLEFKRFKFFSGLATFANTWRASRES